ncbi:GNS1/SUR4 family protein [Besnoitia besnoiti]|uniref:Elongation of fatty acids protein n=1 Tax=Besnoitia besnoiti TaxID=94643 RepID=A0A2A9MBC3_BESBE|nr:GNS1/SUR4 family protein [Besnoitia besnoiti]PFH32692.1 GNS1/SUR4 family protein [Besnoitia besnoiti]
MSVAAASPPLVGAAMGPEGSTRDGAVGMASPVASATGGAFSLSEFFYFYFLRPTGGADLAALLKVPVFIACALYLPLVYGLQRYMRDRPPYSLKTFCFLWNAVLSVLSLLGFFTMLVAQPVLLTKAIYPETQFVPAVRAVICLFTLTKAVEFGDTVILALRKKQLIFLHVYHHLSVTLYCWHAQLVTVSMGHNFAFINLGIHGIMYLYYAASVLHARHRLLVACRPYITLLQTVQMFVGIFLSYEALTSDLPDPEHLNANLALAMYASYFFLFGKFYIEAYMRHLRPNTTQLVVTVHALALGGLWILWGHTRRCEVALELATFFAVTACALPLARNAYRAAAAGHDRGANSLETGVAKAADEVLAYSKVASTAAADAKSLAEAETAPGSFEGSPLPQSTLDAAYTALPTNCTTGKGADSEAFVLTPPEASAAIERRSTSNKKVLNNACQTLLTVSNFLLSWAVEGMVAAAASTPCQRKPGSKSAGGGGAMQADKKKDTVLRKEVDSVQAEPVDGEKGPQGAAPHFMVFDALFALILKPQAPASDPTGKAPPHAAATAARPASWPRLLESTPTHEAQVKRSATGGEATPQSCQEPQRDACTGGTDGGKARGGLKSASDTRRAGAYPETSHHAAKARHVMTRDHGPFACLADFVLVIVSFGTPSVYGWLVHGSWLLGLCVFGALRWLIELYTCDALVKIRVAAPRSSLGALRINSGTREAVPHGAGQRAC